MIRLIVVILLALILTGPAQALVYLERGRQVEGLWVFPLYDQPRQFVYLPSRARLVTDDQGDPRFSFTFFVQADPADGGEDTVQTIRQAGGGAIVHLLVTYDTPAETVEAAQRTLRRKLDDETVTLQGPMVFDAGRYTVVSSLLDGDRETPTPLQTGSAPVLAGNRLALSFRLTAEDAAILLGTFQTDTPDLSIAFELDFSGLTGAYRATLMIDWNKVRSSLGASLEGDFYVVSAQARSTIDRLRNDGAIELQVEGEDTAMDQLLQHVYDKALELLFAPVEPGEFPEIRRQGLLQSLGQAVGGVLGSGTSGSPLPFSVGAAFRLRDLRSEGRTTLSFDKRIRVSRPALVTANLGDLYQRYGDDPSRFKVVAVGGNPVFRQRQVYVGLDGALVPEFDAFVDALQVALRKRHPDGSTTVRELRLTRQEAAIDALYGPLVYGNVAGEAAESWRQFDYRTAWSFRGGIRHVSPWRSTRAATLMISAPYHRREVILAGDMARLEQQGVRALTVQVGTDLFGRQHTVSRVARIGRTDRLEPIQLVLPKGELAYDYRIRWIMASGQRRQACGHDDIGLIFLDDLPTGPTPGVCEGGGEQP